MASRPETPGAPRGNSHALRRGRYTAEACAPFGNFEASGSSSAILVRRFFWELPAMSVRALGGDKNVTRRLSKEMANPVFGFQEVADEALGLVLALERLRSASAGDIGP